MHYACGPSHLYTLYIEDSVCVLFKIYGGMPAIRLVLSLLGCIEDTQCIRCGLLLQMSHVAWSLRLCVSHTNVLGWIGKV